MKIESIKKYSCTFILWVSCLSVCAVNFAYKSELPVVKESGYYHLQLTPDIIANAAVDLSDVRILNANGEEIPYLLRLENPTRKEAAFEPYKIVEEDFLKEEGLSRIVIDNEKRDTISRFYIFINQAETEKYISLRGSDDARNWYAVKRKSKVESVPLETKTEAMLIIDFPSGNYRHYEISIGNPEKEPIKVISVGKYKYEEIIGKYTEIPLLYTRTDSTDKNTYFRFPTLTKSYRIDKIKFEADANFPFFRDGKILSSENVIHRFSIGSDRENLIETSHLRLNKEVVFIIENKDNKPININKITGYQLNRYVCLFLEKEVSYSLYYGNSESVRPEYDIVHFETNIPRELPILIPGEPHQLPVISPVEENREKEVLFIEKPAFLWTVIILVGVVLAIICIKMVYEMKRK